MKKDIDKAKRRLTPSALLKVPEATMKELSHSNLLNRYCYFFKKAISSVNNEECQHARGLIKKHFFKKILEERTLFVKNGDFTLRSLKALASSVDLDRIDKTKNKYDLSNYRDIINLAVFLKIDYETILEAVEVDAVNATIHAIENIKHEIEDFILKN